jgi:hypothetical protein
MVVGRDATNRAALNKASPQRRTHFLQNGMLHVIIPFSTEVCLQTVEKGTHGERKAVEWISFLGVTNSIQIVLSPGRLA